MPGTVTIPFGSAVDVVFAVFFAPTGGEPPTAGSLRPAIAAWRERHLADPLRSGVAAIEERGLVSVQLERVADLQVPPIELLRHMGLGELEERILRAATEAVVVGCPDLNAPPRIGLWSSLSAALAVAERLEGIIYDPEALRILRKDAATRSFTGDGTVAVSRHIMVPFSGGHDAGLGWMTTRGMGKFGLPDIELRDVPPNLFHLNMFLNGVAQFLVDEVFRRSEEGRRETGHLELPTEVEIDSAMVARAGGAALPAGEDPTTVARVGVRFDPHGRDPNPPMILLVPPAGEPDPGVWLNRVAQNLLGDSGDDFRMVATGSDRMLDAHNRAMSELPYAKRRFRAGLREGETLYVKYGFATANGSLEYLWLVVTGWDQGRVRGLVASEPLDVPSLAPGRAVTVDEAGLFDWMLLLPGDRTEGGYTSTVAIEEGRT